MKAQPELEFDPRPRAITTNSSDEFFVLRARAKAGEFVIESIEIGNGLGQWIFRVRWPVDKVPTTLHCEMTGSGHDGRIGLVKRPTSKHILDLAACAGSPARGVGMRPPFHLTAGRPFYLIPDPAMNPKALDAVWQCQCGSPIQKLVLICIAHHSSDSGTGSRPSRGRIARECNLCIRSVTRALRQLETTGWLSVRRTGTPDRKLTNNYVVHVDCRQQSLKLNGGLTVTRDGGLTVRNGGLTVSLTGREQAIKGFKALKGTSKVKSQGVGNGEKDAMEKFLGLLSSEERSAYGANWRLRYRECADKFNRVLMDVESAIKEGAQIISVAAVADIRWREFQPATRR